MIVQLHLFKLYFIFICLYFFISTSGYCQETTVTLKNNSLIKNLEIAHGLIDQNLEDSALFYLNYILSEKYNHKEALISRAKIFYNKGQFYKALIDYNGLISLDPENKEINYARGMVRQELSQYKLAIEDFQLALQLPPGETQTAYFKLEPESKMASGISTLSSMQAYIWNSIGQCYIQLGQYTDAFEALNNGIESDPSYSDLYLNRAIAHEKNMDFEAAIQDYNTVLLRNPDHPVASFNKINLQKHHQKDTELIYSLNNYIEEYPTKSEGYELRGLHYFETGRYTMALGDFQEAAKINPDNLNNLFNLALTYSKTGQTHESEVIFLQIVEADPGYSSAYFNLGNLMFKRSKYEEAISYFTLAHQYNPTNKLILYNRALAYFEDGQQQMACLDMKLVMEMDRELAENFYTRYCNGNE